MRVSGRQAAALMIGALGLTGIGGCAGYHIENGGTGDGYDVYRPEPYVLVIYPPNGGGGSTTDQGKRPEAAERAAAERAAVEHAARERAPADRPVVIDPGEAGVDPAAKESEGQMPPKVDAPPAPLPTVSIVWLPNYNVRYRIRTFNYFGKADFTFKMEEGWKLTSLEDKSDNTAVVTSLIDLAKAALGGGAAAAKTDDGKAGGDSTHDRAFDLYKIVVSADGLTVGLVPAEPKTAAEFSAITRPSDPPAAKRTK